MTEPADDSDRDPAPGSGAERLDDNLVEEPIAEPASPIVRRSRRRRVPALIGAALLVAAGVFLALRGMQQVVARAPATPTPFATLAPLPSQGPASPAPSPTPPPTPMPTSSPLILLP
jgi:hypothetical protein